MRTQYETAQDLTRERQTIDEACRKWKCQPRKIPKRYRLDFALLRGGSIMAYAEVKCRKNPSHQYDTYMIAADKLANAIFWQSAGIQCLLVVKWTDRTGWVNLADCDPQYGFGGRADRGDEDDQEPVAYIPITKFKGL